MKDWDPKGLWDEFRKALQAPAEDDDGQSDDSPLFFHVMVTAPLFLMLLALARR